MSFKLNRLMRAVKADVSALLLIAMLFQLITPVIVFAGDSAVDADFQEALRNSICRVVLDEAPASDPRGQQTDGFVCDLCVLSTVSPLPIPLNTLQDVVYVASILESDRAAFYETDGMSNAQVVHRPGAARAPPFC